jgi:predicted O-methyltransferase YrrM
MKCTRPAIIAFTLLALIVGTTIAQPPGRRGPRDRSGPNAAQLLKPPVPKDDEEKGILDAIAEMREGPRFANVSDPDGRLLRLLAESTGAKRVVEIGTSTGESATWLAMALRKTGGHVYTHEIDDGRAKVAQANFEKAGVEKLITIVMGDAHETVKRYKDSKDELFIDQEKGEGIDILFLDADKQGYIDYLEKLVPLVCPGGLIIAHNMRYPNPDPDYIKEITTNPQFETLFLLMEGAGVGVTMKKR